jgi:hypothetical protein
MKKVWIVVRERFIDGKVQLGISGNGQYPIFYETKEQAISFSPETSYAAEIEIPDWVHLNNNVRASDPYAPKEPEFDWRSAIEEETTQQSNKQPGGKK